MEVSTLNDNDGKCNIRPHLRGAQNPSNVNKTWLPRPVQADSYMIVMT
jgi:hypothetical protein